MTCRGSSKCGSASTKLIAASRDIAEILENRTGMNQGASAVIIRLQRPLVNEAESIVKMN
jgi:hypothetical protein